MTLDIDRRARHYPDRTAIVDHTADRRLGYADLDARAERAARRLAALDVAPGDHVVVLSRNRPELIALLFGARRLGATLAPVSHRLPAETVEAVTDRMAPALVVFEERFADHAAAVDADGRTLAAWRDAAADGAVPEAPPASPPLALHTGGTTGVPKVVPISGRQVEWNCVTEAAAWGLGKDTVSPVLLPMFHTGGWLLLTLPTLYVGGEVVLQRAFEPGTTLEMLEAHGATQVFAVAAIFQALAAHEDFADADLSSVEWFMSGGGPTPGHVVAAYRDRGETFVTGYGLTEGGPNNLFMSPDRPDAADKPDSVGRPFPDCEVRIVDDDGAPVPDGEVGELEVAGPVAAEGYLATEDGTFAGRWVSTGDLARRDGDGDHYVVGRTDNRFVSGGENVSPEAVEAALERHPDVEAVGVVPVAHERWGRVPKAVVVGDADGDALAAHAREHLADFEVPHEFVFVASLPETGAGKLDREALREGHA